MTAVFSVYGHVYYGSHAVAVMGLDAELLHQLEVSGCNRHAVNLAHDSVSADFLDIGDLVSVYVTAIGLLKAPADGMCGITLYMCGQLDEPVLVYCGMMNCNHLEYSLREGSGLVEHHGLCLGKHLKVVGAFDKDSLAACTADSCKEAEGNRDDKGTRATDDQERERTVDPCAPHGTAIGSEYQPEYRRKNSKCNGAEHHGRCVVSGKSGDELLGPGLPGTCVLNQLQDL